MSDNPQSQLIPEDAFTNFPVFRSSDAPDDLLDKTSSDSMKKFGVIEANPEDHRFGDMLLLCNTTKRTFTEVKEKREISDTSKILDLSQNDIIISGFNVDITSSKETLNRWQIEDGLLITKFVERVPPTSWELPEVDDQSTNTYKRLLDEKVTICEELQRTEDFAEFFVADTIKEAKERRIILTSEDHKSPDSSMFPPSISTRICQWPPIKKFTKDLGITYIENYILDGGQFTENWKYTIRSKGVKKQQISDLYLYETKFSLPNKLYPIPQVTAGVFFMMEVSRVVPENCPVKVWLRLETGRRDLDPQKYSLKENDLLTILDLKLANLRKFTF